MDFEKLYKMANATLNPRKLSNSSYDSSTLSIDIKAT